MKRVGGVGGGIAVATSRLLGGLLPRQLMGGVGSCRGGYSMFF